MVCCRRGWRRLASRVTRLFEELAHAAGDVVDLLDGDVRPDRQAQQLIRQRLRDGELPRLPTLLREGRLQVDGRRIADHGIDLALAQPGEEGVALASPNLEEMVDVRLAVGTRLERERQRREPLAIPSGGDAAVLVPLLEARQFPRQ